MKDDLVVAFGPSATGAGSLCSRHKKHMATSNYLMLKDSPLIGQMFQIADKGGAIEYPRKGLSYGVQSQRLGTASLSITCICVSVGFEFANPSMENIHGSIQTDVDVTWMRRD